MKKPYFKVKTLTYSAVLIAMGTVLSIVPLYEMPMGGKVTPCSMMFVALVGWFFGAKVGFTAALAYGLLQTIFDPFVVHPIQYLLDYPLAFACLGATGLFYNKKDGLVTGFLIGVSGRLIFSIVSGVVFFASYAADSGFDNVYVYSFLYNFTYMAPEAAISVLILLLPTVSDALKRMRAKVNC